MFLKMSKILHRVAPAKFSAATTELRMHCKTILERERERGRESLVKEV